MFVFDLIVLFIWDSIVTINRKEPYPWLFAGAIIFSHPRCTLKEIINQTDLYLIILSSKTYIFEDKMTQY